VATDSQSPQKISPKKQARAKSNLKAIGELDDWVLGYDSPNGAPGQAT
jgi:hypothetical protein